MSTYKYTRTSMSLDGFTIDALAALAKKWDISKAEVIRRAVSTLKQQSDEEDNLPTPTEALEWLQTGGGGLLREEAEEFRKEVQAERTAKTYWWQE